jgi:death-on-curing protein
MIYLTLDEILRVAARVIDRDVEIRDAGLLEAAVARPQATVFGADAYPDLHSKVAALLLSLPQNQALVDGNKRLALGATIVMLGVNGWSLTMTSDDAYELVMNVAEGLLREVADVADHLRSGSKPHP